MLIDLTLLFMSITYSMSFHPTMNALRRTKPNHYRNIQLFSRFGTAKTVKVAKKKVKVVITTEISENTKTPELIVSKLPLATKHNRENTLYIMDGTAMLYHSYFSTEHKFQYKNDTLTAALSSELLSALPESAVKDLRNFYSAELNTIKKNSSQIIADLSSEVEDVGTLEDVSLQESISSSVVGNETLAIKSGAITAMAMAFARFVRDEKPKYVAMAFDAGKKTFRNELFPSYKEQRSSVPVDLIPLFGIVPQVFESLGCKVFMQVGYEADDIMASLGTWAAKQGLQVVHVSNDKDMLQLVGDGVRVLLPRNNDLLGVSEVQEKFGVRPDQLCDYQALIGDSVDNIPGVKGIGPKAGAALLQHFGHIESLYSRLHLMDIPPVTPDLQALKPSDPTVIAHLKACLGATKFAEATAELTAALKGAKVSVLSTLVRLYQCNYSELLVFRQLVTLKTDLSLEDAMYANHKERMAAAKIAERFASDLLLSDAPAPAVVNSTAAKEEEEDTDTFPVITATKSNGTSGKRSAQRAEDTAESALSAGKSTLCSDYFLYSGDLEQQQKKNSAGDGADMRSSVAAESSAGSSYVLSVSSALMKPLLLLRQQFSGK